MMNLSLPTLSLLLFSAFSSADIPLGATLHASHLNQSWTSPESNFSLRFIPATDTAGSFSAAITCAQIPIWRAGGGASLVDSGGSLQLLASGNLRLVNGSGTILWESGTAGLGVSHAALDDSGNLVLLRNGNIPAWSTFDNPTDTIVPSQNFTTSNTLRAGPYTFALSKSGNLALRWNGSIVYWNQGLNSSVNTNLSSPSLGIQSIGTLALSDPTLSAPVVMAYSSDYAEGSDLLRFMRLDSDGNLRIYSFDRGTGNSNVRWVAVRDQCEVFGYCGNFGICSYNDAMSPICSCPSKNFEFIDGEDSRKGCRRKEEIENCRGGVTMLELDHAKFMTYPPESPSQVFFLGIMACRVNCLMGGGSCVALTSLSDGSGSCYMKVPGFVSGYRSPKLASTSYVKVCGPVAPNPSSASLNGGDDSSPKLQFQILAAVIAGTFLGLLSLQVSFWWWRRNCCCPKFRGQQSSTPYEVLEYASGAPVRFCYKDLHCSTGGFKVKLGGGGFGSVYRGVLGNGTIVAVKQLEGNEHGEKQFRMEAAAISCTHHLNLVRLIGFCCEGRHRLLVYEFMKNGSLNTFLSPSEGRLLNWENRFRVALGVARGITYLHEECRDCIVHCNIKPENILLDGNYNAKVSDFGLPKLMNPEQDLRRGYLAPERTANLPITTKSDVYSYGMVLLEIVSGRRNFEVSAESDGKKLWVWAYEEFEKGRVEGIVDKRLGEGEVDMEQVKRAVMVSFWCIQEQPLQRPTMGKVVQMLEGMIEIEMPPVPKIVLGEVMEIFD